MATRSKFKKRRNMSTKGAAVRMTKNSNTVCFHISKNVLKEIGITPDCFKIKDKQDGKGIGAWIDEGKLILGYPSENADENNTLSQPDNPTMYDASICKEFEEIIGGVVKPCKTISFSSVEYEEDEDFEGCKLAFIDLKQYSPEANIEFSSTIKNEEVD